MITRRHNNVTFAQNKYLRISQIIRITMLIELVDRLGWSALRECPGNYSAQKNLSHCFDTECEMQESREDRENGE